MIGRKKKRDVNLTDCGKGLEACIKDMERRGIPETHQDMVEARGLLSWLNGLFGLKQGVNFSDLDVDG